MCTTARQRGFTLLEICVVMFLAMMLMALAVPSLTGVLSERRLQGSFDRFDSMVIEAQRRSITEGRPFVLSWGKNGTVRLYPAEWSDEQRRKRGPLVSAVPTAADGRPTIKRASLSPGAAASEWMFWPTGTCEPAIIHSQGPAGEWQAAYNPLSARAKMQLFVSR